MSRLLKVCRIEDLDEVRGRAAGQACGRAGTSDGIDPTVVVGAVARRDLVVTSDRNDVAAVAAALGASIEIMAI